jgi:hypothetical protein
VYELKAEFFPKLLGRHCCFSVIFLHITYDYANSRIFAIGVHVEMLNSPP